MSSILIEYVDRATGIDDAAGIDSEPALEEDFNFFKINFQTRWLRHSSSLFIVRNHQTTRIKLTIKLHCALPKDARHMRESCLFGVAKLDRLSHEKNSAL